jgi:hypothetical protein
VEGLHCMATFHKQHSTAQQCRAQHSTATLETDLHPFPSTVQQGLVALACCAACWMSVRCCCHCAGEPASGAQSACKQRPPCEAWSICVAATARLLVQHCTRHKAVIAALHNTRAAVALTQRSPATEGLLPALGSAAGGRSGGGGRRGGPGTGISIRKRDCRREQT